jgi:hypothetical protein
MLYRHSGLARPATPWCTISAINIATRHASGEEAVGAVFVQNSGKVALGIGRGMPTTATDKGTKRGVESDNRVAKAVAPMSHSHC